MPSRDGEDPPPPDVSTQGHKKKASRELEIHVLGLLWFKKTEALFSELRLENRRKRRNKAWNISVTLPDHEPEASLNVDFLSLLLSVGAQNQAENCWTLPTAAAEDIWGLFLMVLVLFQSFTSRECLIATDKLFKWNCTHRPQLCFFPLLFYFFLSRHLRVCMCVCFCTSVCVCEWVCDCPCDQNS